MNHEYSGKTFLFNLHQQRVQGEKTIIVIFVNPFRERVTNIHFLRIFEKYIFFFFMCRFLRFNGIVKKAYFLADFCGQTPTLEFAGAIARNLLEIFLPRFERFTSFYFTKILAKISKKGKQCTLRLKSRVTPFLKFFFDAYENISKLTKNFRGSGNIT